MSNNAFEREDLKKFVTHYCGNVDTVMCMDCYNDIMNCICKEESYLSLWCERCQELYDRDLLDLEYCDSFELDALEPTADEIDPDYVPGFDLDTVLEDIELGYPSSGAVPDVGSLEGAKKIEDNKPKPKYVTTSAGKVKTVQNGSYLNGGHQMNTGQHWQKCRHYAPKSAMEIAKGVTVYPSSMSNDRKDNEFFPDFGLYADKGWNPAWRNEFIVFPDYGIPRFNIVAVEQITSACVRASELNQKVEMGCIGGHGRTGTILACMKIWGSYKDGNPVSPTAAIKWVHTEYCEHAIETDEQEWWVSYYAHHQFGIELPKKPEKKSWGGNKGKGKKLPDNTPCQEIHHVEMMAAGAITSCLSKSDCSFWATDYYGGTDKNYKKEGKDGGGVGKLGEAYRRNEDRIDPNKVESWKKVLEGKASKKASKKASPVQAKQIPQPKTGVKKKGDSSSSLPFGESSLAAKTKQKKKSKKTHGRKTHGRKK